MTADGRCRVLIVVRELRWVHYDSKVLFVVAVVVIEMQEDSPMNCRYPSACHTLHCYRGRFFRLRDKRMNDCPRKRDGCRSRNYLRCGF